ncbi:ATP-binding protein [Kitasatospora sp. NBC_01300]|uniref:ATP-binding protein n=1 Tax=Kitasatospora sp. NBC_01300 TaxID=2903574 RepID=UPI00352F5FF4|nr:ATP-binding protein [Kitasatospora sp. NBC_01300]
MVVHSHVFFLTRDPVSVPVARRKVRSRVASWGVLLDEDSRLALNTVTSELVTNAVRHSDRPMLTVAVYVSVRLRRALVEVYDGSIALPRRRQAGTDAESGRGLELVECLALAHGAERTEQGKRVWAELALPEQSVTRRQIIAGPRRAIRAVLRALPRPGRPPIRPPFAPGSTRPRTAD